MNNVNQDTQTILRAPKACMLYTVNHSTVWFACKRAGSYTYSRHTLAQFGLYGPWCESDDWPGFVNAGLAMLSAIRASTIKDCPWHPCRPCLWCWERSLVLADNNRCSAVLTRLLSCDSFILHLNTGVRLYL